MADKLNAVYTTGQAARALGTNVRALWARARRRGMAPWRVVEGRAYWRKRQIDELRARPSGAPGHFAKKRPRTVDKGR